MLLTVLHSVITQLLKKEHIDQFTWSPTAQNAFELLQKAITSAHVLATPNFSQTFIVECDASCTGLGAVLMQNGHPIAYFSNVISNRSMVKSAYEWELMALVLEVQHWRSYLVG